MLDLLVLLAECDYSEITSSCCTSIGHVIALPVSGSADYSLEVDSGEVEALFCQYEDESLFCQCDYEDVLVECLSCGSLFDLDTFCLGC
jgi:hypothetical protein